MHDKPTKNYLQIACHTLGDAHDSRLSIKTKNLPDVHADYLLVEKSKHDPEIDEIWNLVPIGTPIEIRY